MRTGVYYKATGGVHGVDPKFFGNPRPPRSRNDARRWSCALTLGRRSAASAHQPKSRTSALVVACVDASLLPGNTVLAAESVGRLLAGGEPVKSERK
jgi:hypothetical protein